MPTINIYSQNTSFDDSALARLKQIVVEQLSCWERQLELHEISVRVIEVTNSYMIAPVECEIKAHHYPERIAKQDQICMEIKTYMMQQMTSGEEVSVWLQLSDLWHSF